MFFTIKKIHFVNEGGKKHLVEQLASFFYNLKKKKRHVRSKFSLVIPASELAVIAPGRRNIHSD